MGVWKWTLGRGWLLEKGHLSKGMYACGQYLQGLSWAHGWESPSVKKLQVMKVGAARVRVHIQVGRPYSESGPAEGRVHERWPGGSEAWSAGQAPSSGPNRGWETEV